MEKVGFLYELAVGNELTGEQPAIRPYTPTSDEGGRSTALLTLSAFAC